MNTDHIQNEFKKLKSQLYDMLPQIESFAQELREGHMGNNYIIYDFQKLMDRMSTIKGEADEITRTLDHG